MQWTLRWLNVFVRDFVAEQCGARCSLKRHRCNFVSGAEKIPVRAQVVSRTGNLDQLNTASVLQCLCQTVHHVPFGVLALAASFPPEAAVLVKFRQLGATPLPDWVASSQKSVESVNAEPLLAPE